MILIICQQGQRWGEGGRHSWWYGYWDTNSLGRVITSQLPSFWQRRRVLLGGISRERFSLSWSVLWWIPCRLDVRWGWVGKPWLIGVQTSPWVQWHGCMVRRVVILWGFSQRICLHILWGLLVEWLFLWQLLERWLLILLFIWLQAPECNCLCWRTWHVVPASKSWRCCIAHLQYELLHYVAYIIGGIAAPILLVVLQLSTYNWLGLLLLYHLSSWSPGW